MSIGEYMNELAHRIVNRIDCDPALLNLVRTIEDKPAVVIADAVREYIAQVAACSVADFVDIFGYKTYETALTMGDTLSECVNNLLDFVNFDAIADRIIWDSHRHDAYVDADGRE